MIVAMGTRAYVAIDLGAESGRVILGTLAAPPGASESPTLELVELHRFTHEPLVLESGLHWNVPHIWAEILTGLRAAAACSREHGVEVASVGVDAWGVDFVLVDSAGRPLGPPRCYRDPRWGPGVALVGSRIGYERLYRITGIQEMAINTLVQLATAVASGEGLPAGADRLLFMPDYFHFLLGGEAGNESSIASTSQMLDAATGEWSGELLAALGIPERLVRAPHPPGARRGRLSADVCKATGLSPDVRICAPGSHDTASAVAGVPAPGGSWAYLSSGTWSLMGVELAGPILSDAARRAGFTNERGVGNTIRFLKNVSGLWIVQELRRDLERRGTTLDYAELTAAAAGAQAFRSRIDACHPSLSAPGGSIEKIRALAAGAGDPEPRTPGELARCCLEALAMAYRVCLGDLETLWPGGPTSIDTIHVVGGGSKNELLNQMTANATGRRVVAGPAEATAAGNILTQAMHDGQVPDLAGIRGVVARSFGTKEYAPVDGAAWGREFERFRVR
jgi:rhamnulokinase